MRLKCICGNSMRDETTENNNSYFYFLDNDYYDFLETDPQTIAEMVDGMLTEVMKKSGFIECLKCGRLVFPGKVGEIVYYKKEESQYSKIENKASYKDVKKRNKKNLD